LSEVQNAQISTGHIGASPLWTDWYADDKVIAYMDPARAFASSRCGSISGPASCNTMQWTQVLKLVIEQYVLFSAPVSNSSTPMRATWALVQIRQEHDNSYRPGVVGYYSADPQETRRERRRGVRRRMSAFRPAADTTRLLRSSTISTEALLELIKSCLGRGLRAIRGVNGI
jgi:hypothetical protein